MLTNFCRNVQNSRSLLPIRRFCTPTTSVDPISLYEPIFEVKAPEIPLYPYPVLFRFRGYDYVVLEQFVSYVQKVSRELFKFNTHKKWPTPARCEKVSVYRPFSRLIAEEYQLKTYERSISFNDVPSVQAQIFFDLLRTNLPKGVEMTIKQFTAQEEEARLVPEYEVMALREELSEVEEQKRKIASLPVV